MHWVQQVLRIHLLMRSFFSGNTAVQVRGKCLLLWAFYWVYVSTDFPERVSVCYGRWWKSHCRQKNNRCLGCIRKWDGNVTRKSVLISLPFMSFWAFWVSEFPLTYTAVCQHLTKLPTTVFIHCSIAFSILQPSLGVLKSLWLCHRNH